MKPRNVYFLISVLVWFFCAQAKTSFCQPAIEGLIVETYYIADANDAVHDDEGTNLPEGSVTYRIFLDLAPGFSITEIFGSELNPWVVRSSELIWNHSERGETLGSDFNDSRLDDNTAPLDSYFTLGAATDEHFGIPKSLDFDGSIVGGENNDGGSEMVEGGLLVNDDDELGIALTTADGLIQVPEDSIPNISITSFPELGLTFENETTDSVFIVNSTNKTIPFSAGVKGVTEENIVMIAQITTLGELEFQFNVKLKVASGDEFVFVSDTAVGDSALSPFLSFPPDCGCTDPDFLEFDPAAPCDDGTCQTLIAFGCTDPAACNFNPDANFNIPELCCYGIDDCNNLDWTIICPSLSTDDPTFEFNFKLYPNPTISDAWMSISSEDSRYAELSIYTLQGQQLYTQRVQIRQGEQELRLVTNNLPQGTYLVRLHDKWINKTSILVKN